MNDDLRNRIHNNMSTTETGELLEIWQNSDEWTETVLKVVKEILQSRLGKLPSQNDFQGGNDEVASEDEALTLDDGNMENIEHEAPVKKGMVCPSCRGENLAVRDIGLQFNHQKLILKKPRKYFDDLFIDDEVVGILCKDCGFVYLMLKGYV
ncbi:MAG: hypothetical protein CVU44_00125 [Chloroflexi bacterium HGW-Chloroflexi-6]|nr:MAG: hypothetical protein CVU44_00125 [Chloroflexi bacterium HGW-Chloroflexi-6]